MSDATKRRYSYTLGYLMGLCAPPLKLPSKQPTAYSYNGVVLPALPEVPEGYENLYLYYWNKTAPVIVLLASSKPFHYEGGKVCCASSFVYYESAYSANEPYFHDFNGAFNNDAYEDTDLGVSTKTVFWTNTKMQNLDDGTVYLEKTEPIPVYE